MFWSTSPLTLSLLPKSIPLRNLLSLDPHGRPGGSPSFLNRYLNTSEQKSFFCGRRPLFTFLRPHKSCPRPASVYQQQRWGSDPVGCWVLL
jgi:hypothetical protein